MVEKSMRYTLSQLTTFMVMKGISKESIFKIEKKYMELEDKLEKSYMLSHENPNTLPERIKKIIFLAKHLNVQESGSRKWKAQKMNFSLTMEETSFVEAAYELIYGTKDVYLVYSRFFWKVDSIEDLISRQGHGEFAVSTKADTDIILNRDNFKLIDNDNFDINSTQSLIALRYCQQIPGFSSMPKDKQCKLITLVSESIAYA